MLGFSLDEIIGRTVDESCILHDTTLILQITDKLKENRPIHNLELQLCTKSGKLRDMLASFDVVEHEGEPHILCFCYDITRWKKAEIDLKEQLEENVRLLEENCQRTRVLGSIAQISSALRKASTREEMLSIFLQETSMVLNANSTGILFVENEELELAGVYGRGEEFTGTRFPRDVCTPLWRMMDNRKNVSISASEGIQMFEGCGTILSLIEGVEHGEFIPLNTPHTTIGLLFALFDSNEEKEASPDSHNGENHLLLLAAADIASNAFYRTRLMETLERRVKERTLHLSTLYDITKAVSETHELEAMFNLVLDRTLDALHSNAGTVHLKNESDLMLLYAHQGLDADDVDLFSNKLLDTEIWSKKISLPNEPLTLDLLTAPEPLPALASKDFASAICIPLRVKDEILGLLSIFRKTDQSYSREDKAILLAIADQAGGLVETINLRQQAQQAAVVEERQRLARELHDSVNQLLYSLTLFARGGKNYARDKDWARAAESLEDIDFASKQALKEMRLLLYELRPAEPEQEGLLEALHYRLRSVEQRAGVDAQLIVEGETRQLQTHVEKELYRIAQEALNNSLKHAQADTVTVRFMASEKCVELEIKDNGNGFEKEAVHDGMGLMSMQERMENLGGSCIVQSVPGKGTIVKASMELPTII